MTTQSEKKPRSTSRDSKPVELILFNDDFHTFEFVIEKLQQHCNHSPEQAEQCALIAHHKGEASVMVGAEEVIEAIHAKLAFEGLIVDVRKVTV